MAEYMQNGLVHKTRTSAAESDCDEGSPNWDYSRLARYYELRAPYHSRLIPVAAAALGISEPARIADIGAGTGRLAAAWAALGCRVDAVEPCREMRELGQSLTSSVCWHATAAEATSLPDRAFKAVSFGSSLNVVDAPAALAEAARLLQPGCALVVAYNHRKLHDPTQRAIEQTIRQHLPGFSYGERRRDPTATIEASGYFQVCRRLGLEFEHRTSAAKFAEGFRSHATLRRQSGKRFPTLLNAIHECVAAYADANGMIKVPFVSRAWLAGKC